MDFGMGSCGLELEVRIETKAMAVDVAAHLASI
jgi:hypothetical protein